MNPLDKKYIQKLAQGLKGIQEEALEVIMGPEELKVLLQRAHPEDFLGPHPWINLHTHSAFSDGKLSPEEWVQNAFYWKQKNHLMQYVIALTDHDSIDGLIRVLKYVAQNHSKLKGLRIVLGCELSTCFEDEYLRRPLDFEILHYGVNPFDKRYVQLLKQQADRRHQHLPQLLDQIHQKYPWLPVDEKDFQKSRFYGANMKKGLGVNWLYDLLSYFKSVVPPGSDLSPVFDDMLAFGGQNEKRDMWYSSSFWLHFIQSHGGWASMAHPYRLQLGQKLATSVDCFIPHFMAQLSAQGLTATELYYGQLGAMQSAFDAMRAGGLPANETDRWIQLIQGAAHASFALSTGGADNHDAYLGNGQYRAMWNSWQDVLHLWQEVQPLIEAGYRLLNKEVTMGLPGPCMPIFDIRYDLGIGSPYGAGAKRVWDFFGKAVNKILLGPAGRTTREAGHSPYVSDDEHPNPFFVPTETLIDKGLLKVTEADFFRHSNCTDHIDFDLVEENFEMMLSKIHCAKKTPDEQIDQLADQLKQQNKFPYIADMQIQIAKPLLDQNKELFLENFVLGTPGDDMSDQPRNWGFPVWNPDQLFQKKGTLGPAGKLWQHLLDQAMTGAKGGLRIDHFIGFVNPYVISLDPHLPNGRLYSSYDHPVLGKYAFHQREQFYQITEKILLPLLKKHHLTKMDLYPEDIGARPEQLDAVLDHFGLGRLIVAQFNQPQNEGHVYQLMNARPHDIATLDTHDTPSIQMFFDGLNEGEQEAHAIHLANSLRFNYTNDLRAPEQLVRMQWAELLACPAKRVQAFFTSWTGQQGRYNHPGHPDKWHLRCLADFDQLYFKNLYAGRAYNPLDAIALAIFARGDDFYHQNADFVRRLREKEQELKGLIGSWLESQKIFQKGNG